MVKCLIASILRYPASSCEPTNLPEHGRILRRRKCTSPTVRLLCQLVVLLAEDLSSMAWHILEVRQLTTTRGNPWVTLAGTGISCSSTFASRRSLRLLHKNISTATDMSGRLMYMRMVPCRWDSPHGNGLPRVSSLIEIVLCCAQDG